MRFDCVSARETLSDPINRPPGLRQRLGRAELHRPGSPRGREKNVGDHREKGDFLPGRASRRLVIR